MSKPPEPNPHRQTSSQALDSGPNTKSGNPLVTRPDNHTISFGSSDEISRSVEETVIIGKDKDIDSTPPGGFNPSPSSAGISVSRQERGRWYDLGECFQGKYEIVRLLGEGGMGQVYQARHIELGTMVAIKVLNRAFLQDDQAIERFKREARASAKIVHPNAVRVFDYGVQNGTCYLVMEFLEGESLRKRLAVRKRLLLSEVVHFAEQVCYVLEVMHRKGIVHRDLKPDNVFFHLQEDTEVVKVLDFGLAKVNTATQVGAQLTQPGSIVGTPHYMSPEQCQGEELDGRSDLYSLGVILYEMLAGHPPFTADTSLSILFKHVNEAPPPLSEVAPDMPATVSDVVMRMLAKNPADRYQSAKSFLQAFCEAASVGKSLYLEMLDKSRPGTGEISAAPPGARTTLRAPAVKARAAFPAYLLTIAILGVAATVAVVVWKQYPASVPISGGETTSTSNPAAGVPGDDFVLIPGGNFTIGRDPADCQSVPDCKIEPEEAPPHTVTLASYYLSKYEVTNKEYHDFIVATGHQPPQGWKEQNYPIGTDDFPVTYVRWDDATAYCRWRAERDHIQFRLPTEDEWEHAARGNDARLYPWGDAWNNNFANANRPKESSSVLPIKEAPNNTGDRSPSGIFAMAGNVSEWTSSDFKIYPGSSYKPTKSDLECKVYRGGSFKSTRNVSRTTYRVWDKPDFSDNYLGFRLAATPLQPGSK